MGTGFLITGAPEQACIYLERVNDYDPAAARLDALVAASQGDPKAAAKKIRWAHARDALPNDPDLIFLNADAPTTFIPTSGIDAGGYTALALEMQVSDVVLAVSMFGAASGRIDPREARTIIQASDGAPLLDGAPGYVTSET